MNYNRIIAVTLFCFATHTAADGVFLQDVEMPPETDNVYVHKLGDSKQASDFIVFIKKGVPPHKHLKHTETVYVLEGEGVFTLEGVTTKIAPGHYVKIPQGAVHSVEVTSSNPLKVLSIQAPQFFGKDRVWVKTAQKQQDE